LPLSPLSYSFAAALSQVSIFAAVSQRRQKRFAGYQLSTHRHSCSQCECVPGESCY